MTKQRTYDPIARVYDLLDLPFERRRYRPIRPGLFQGLAGEILDAGLDPADQLPALRELKRICRPGGRIRLLEYRWSEDPRRRLVQWLWLPWVRFAYGTAFDRDTGRHVEAAGLELVRSKSLYEDMIELLELRA